MADRSLPKDRFAHARKLYGPASAIVAGSSPGRSATLWFTRPRHKLLLDFTHDRVLVCQCMEVDDEDVLLTVRCRNRRAQYCRVFVNINRGNDLSTNPQLSHSFYDHLLQFLLCHAWQKRSSLKKDVI